MVFFLSGKILVQIFPAALLALDITEQRLNNGTYRVNTAKPAATTTVDLLLLENEMRKMEALL